MNFERVWEVLDLAPHVQIGEVDEMRTGRWNEESVREMEMYDVAVDRVDDESVDSAMIIGDE